MDPTVAAAAIAGGADIAGTLFGSASSAKESRKNREEARRQFNIQDDYNKNFTQYRVKDALKAGVNPLAALGQSGNYSPTVHTGGSSGAGDTIANGFSRVGDRIQNAINSFYERKNRESVNLDVKSKKLDVESKELENKLLKSKIDTATQPGFVDPDSVISISDVALNPDLYSHDMIGKSSPYPSLLKKWSLPNGKIVQLIDPDSIADTDFTNIEGDRAIALAYPFLRRSNGTRFRDSVSAMWRRRRRTGSFFYNNN